MSDQSQGPGWWMASDGKWYPPESDPAPPPPGQFAAPFQPAYVQRSTNGMAIASMVLGIVWIYWIGSILALVFGYLARKQIAESQGTQQGDGMAIAGIVLGWIGLGILAAGVVIGIISSVAGASSGY